MRVITWNIHGANLNSKAWDYLTDLNPDIILLQEVRSLPDKIKNKYDILSRVATTKFGKSQRFHTSVLVKGEIIGECKLESEFDWVNRQLELFRGNLICCTVKLPDYNEFNVVSVYSPAWSIENESLKGLDISEVKLKLNPRLFVTEIIWSALKNSNTKKTYWIVGGDHNCCETFDREWQKKNGVKYGLQSSGNKEILDRMTDLGFNECLRKFNNDRIVPTFRHSRGKVLHQLDHLFVTENLYCNINNCFVGEDASVFDNYLSDHLPIIADFNY